VGCKPIFDRRKRHLRTGRSTPAHQKVSLLETLLPEYVSPELLYLEVKWGSLMPYEASCDLLHDVLPIDEKLHVVTIRNHLFAVAERMEQELGEELPCWIEGDDEDWAQLPIPNGPLTVGLDGGFVPSRNKRGCFEVIVGKSILEFRRDEEPQTVEVVQSMKEYNLDSTWRRAE
jgi:hypothetical protein